MEDRQRFARFVEEHMAVVYAAAYSATGDRAVSEEVAQETFLCAWRKLPGLDRPPVMPAWLCGIARMMARNVRRRRGRELPLELEARPLASDAPSPLDALLRRERELLVRRALARVPRRYREPLVLYYQGEESVQAVADALGLTSSAVRQRLSRGRKQLRDEVDLVERELRATRPRAGLAAAIAAAFTPFAIARASSLPALLSFAPTATLCGLLGSFSVAPAPAADPVAGGGIGSWGLGVGERTDPDPEGSRGQGGEGAREGTDPILNFSPDPIARRRLPVAGPRSPVSSDSDDFTTARELLRRGFPSGALPHLERVVRRGPADRHYRPAITSLVAVARALPDPSSASAILASLPPADLPATAEIHYLLARHHYATDPRRALVHLAAVPSGAPRALDARLLAGVIHVRLGQAGPAERAFESALALARDPAPRARLSAGERAAARDRALLDLGRLHYSTRRYQRALDAFGRIGRRSPAWPTALFESTWAHFRAGDAARGLGHIHSLKAPHFAASSFPETARVEALFYFQRCHFRRAERVTRDFEARHGPVLRDLDRITASRPDDDLAFLATARALRAAAPSPPRTSPATAVAAAPPATASTRQLAGAALADREVDRALARVAELDRELSRLARADAAWRASPIAARLLEDLTVERSLAAQAAGRLTRARLRRLAGELRELQAHLRRIRIEILGIRAAHVGRRLPAEPDPAVYAIDDQNSFWPFDGEYWRDELGRYYVSITSVCR